MPRRIELSGLLACLCLMLAACGAVLTDDTNGMSRAEKALAAEVKGALFAEPDLPAAAIEIDCEDQTVRLSGFVETADQRRRAARAAEGVEGVERVENRIQVK